MNKTAVDKMRAGSESHNRMLSWRKTALLLILVSTILFLTGCGGSNSSPITNHLNPPPSNLQFVSQPTTQSSEGSTYSYAIQTNAPGTSLQLTTAPAGATLSSGTINWTPTQQQARTANQFTVTASNSGLTATQSWSVSPAGTIRGTTASTCVSDSGVTTSSANAFAGGPLKALVPNNSGTFDTYTGTWGANGTFSIANVPAGPFWLIAANANLWTSSSNFDFGQRTWGGCQYEAPSQPGTSLAITATGLNPWQHYDYFSFAVPNARTGAGALPADGATTVSLTVPYGNLLLLNAANGDNAYVSQLVSATYAGIEFHALGNFWGPQPITLQDGQVNSLNPVLQPVPQSNSFRANIKGSAFISMYNDMFPGATEGTPGDNLRLEVTPDSSAPSSNGVYLVLMSQGLTADTDAGDVAYANPYPSAWTTFYDYYDFAMAPLNVPGAAPYTVGLITEVKSNNLPTAAAPIAPLVGPALNPQINRASLFSNQTISGTTPTIAWQSPSVGTASGYSIMVYEVVVNAGAAQLQYQTTISTIATSVTLPPGMLTSGKMYYFEIASLYRNGGNLDSTPYLHTYPEAETHLGSGVITLQ